MKCRKALAAVIVVLLLLSLGCSQKAQADTEAPIVLMSTKAPMPPKMETVIQPQPTEAPDPIVAPEPTSDLLFAVTDASGREVRFDRPVEKVVALMPADCEIIFALGAEEALIGRGETCDYPPEVMDLPVLTGDMGSGIQQILALAPDALFIEPKELAAEQMEQLEHAGIHVVVAQARTIEGTYDRIRLISQVMDRQAEGERIIADMQRTFDQIKADPIASEKTIYFEVDPPQWGLMTAGAGTLMNEVAQMMGLKNCFSDIEGEAHVSETQVLERDPDYIVTVALYLGEGPTPDEEIAERDGWQDVTAVKNLDILYLSGNELSQPGPRLAEGAQMLYDFVVESLAAQEPAPAE